LEQELALVQSEIDRAE